MKSMRGYDPPQNVRRRSSGSLGTLPRRTNSLSKPQRGDPNRTFLSILMATTLLLLVFIGFYYNSHGADHHGTHNAAMTLHRRLFSKGEMWEGVAKIWRDNQERLTTQLDDLREAFANFKKGPMDQTNEHVRPKVEKIQAQVAVIQERIESVGREVKNWWETTTMEQEVRKNRDLIGRKKKELLSRLQEVVRATEQLQEQLKTDHKLFGSKLTSIISSMAEKLKQQVDVMISRVASAGPRAAKWWSSMSATKHQSYSEDIRKNVELLQESVTQLQKTAGKDAKSTVAAIKVETDDLATKLHQIIQQSNQCSKPPMEGAVQQQKDFFIAAADNLRDSVENIRTHVTEIKSKPGKYEMRDVTDSLEGHLKVVQRLADKLKSELQAENEETNEQ
eukprot:GHVT01045043.1.p1 GENE.GHVT01045043.1~~GHVT01045043.1.p1  ORF type:complete len:391 (-),score=53.88 GHVT01045043.1:608-1780(-)